MSATQPKRTRKRQANGGAETPGTLNYEAVLSVVLSWPPTMRSALMHDILDTLTQPNMTTSPERNTLGRALGLLSTERPAPSDKEVKRWLDEHRTSKYG